MTAGMSTAVTAFSSPTTIAHAHTRSPHAFFLPLPSLRDVDWSWWWHLQMHQQHQLWSWEWGVGRNQVVQDFLGDVVHPWGGGEPNGRNLNLTPKLNWSQWWHLQMHQQHQLWSWEWGVGRNQVVQDFLGDVVHPWGGVQWQKSEPDTQANPAPTWQARTTMR